VKKGLLYTGFPQIKKWAKMKQIISIKELLREIEKETSGNLVIY